MLKKFVEKEVEKGIRAFLQKIRISLSVLESVGRKVPLTREIISALMAVAEVIGVEFTAIKEASNKAKFHREQANGSRATAEHLVQQASKMDERAAQLEALVALLPDAAK